MDKTIIGFCGSRCTGKTTLALWLADEYHDKVELCVEGARESAAELGIQNVAQIMPHQRQRFQERILERHLDALFDFKKSKKSILICDRTVIDILVYTWKAIQNYEPIEPRFWKLLYNQCRLPYYTKIVYFDLFKITADQMNDGFRRADLGDREAVAREILSRLTEFEISFLRIPDRWVDRQEFIRWQLGLQ